MSGKEKDKKSFWEEFFGTYDEEESSEKLSSTPQEERVIPVRNEDEDLMSLLEGREKKSAPKEGSPVVSNEPEVGKLNEEEISHIGDEETPTEPKPKEENENSDHFKEVVEEEPSPDEGELEEEIDVIPTEFESKDDRISISLENDTEDEALPVESGDDHPSQGEVDETPTEPEPEEENHSPGSFKEKKEALTEAPAGQYFVIHNGPTLKDLWDLEYYLGTMTKKQFDHHTADGRNDFASWVRDVLKEGEIAYELEKVRGRKEMYDVLAKFLKLR